MGDFLRQKRVGLLLVFLLAAVSAPGWGEGGRGGDPERPDSARTEVAPAAVKTPDDPDLLFRLAREQEDGQAAERLYRALIEKFPNHPLADDALFALGMGHYSLGYYQTAGRDFEQILEQYPDGDRVEDAAYWSGMASLASDNFDAALERFQWLIERYPSSEKSSWARVAVADCFRLRGDFRLAADAYQETLERFPSADLESETLFHLAQTYEEMEETGKALELYRQLSEKHPDTYEGVQAIERVSRLAGAVPATADSLAVRPIVSEEPSAGAAPAAIGRTETETAEVWTIQVGAFALEENAARLVRVLEAQGYRHVRLGTDTSGTQPIHRVWVGRFVSEDEARGTAKILREQEHLETRVLMQKIGSPPTP